MKQRLSPDLAAVALLIGLWLLFFWRLFTPITADQASLKQGDFSGQFVAFAGYQAARWSAGEIPLWNPYNNGGLPFIADTQAAVFYPPRLVTIALSNLAGGWSYHALELEMTAHVLAYTLFMYSFMRVVTRGYAHSMLGSVIGALIVGYSGFTTGYAPLQLAILEAAIWLPLAMTGVWWAAGGRFRPLPLVVTGAALGLSWMAGHPQTSFFITWLLIALWAWRVYVQRHSWIVFIVGGALFGGLAFGLAAVQLIPGLEYLTLTTRTGFSYDAKANGFPIQDVVQFAFPGVVSLYSPLHIGVVGVILALFAMMRRVQSAWFWAGVALFALLWSFGGNSPLYPLLYNVLPGLRFFRGQERAAFLVMSSLAVLAGLGAAALPVAGREASADQARDYAAALRLRVWLNRTLIGFLAVTLLMFIAWIGSPGAYSAAISPVVFAALIVGGVYLLLPNLIAQPQRPLIAWSLAGLLALELFTAHMDSPATYDPVPPETQLSMTAPPLVAQVLGDPDPPFRVDGERGLMANYGSLYGVQDIRGISPLFLERAWLIVETDLRQQRAWELFAVRYVFTDWDELPVPSTIVGTGQDALGSINLHRLTDPRPFAAVLHRYYVEPNDSAAVNLLRDPGIDPRRLAILNADPGVSSNDAAPLYTTAQVVSFAPERIEIRTDSAFDGVLTTALVDYPGWHASVDGEPTPMLRAYGALSAVALPAGAHTVTLIYDPLTYRVGAVISGVTWLAVVIVMIGTGIAYAAGKRASTVGG
ncbi:MAG: YfhO family protein [bacterium]|nr:YfhO family protein [bacterium]